MLLKDIQFNCAFTGGCEWTTEGNSVKDEVFESVLDSIFDSGKSILLVHFYFCGSSAPDYFILDDYEDTVEYLNEHAKAGDRIEIYCFDDMLEAAKCLGAAKCPNEAGEVPEGGAY